MDTSNVIIIILINLFISLLIYLIFHKIAFKNVFKGLKQYNQYKNGFYECGFRSRFTYKHTYTINMYVICSLAILYDIESIFLLIFFVNLQYLCILDIILILIYLLTFILGFYFELSLKNTEWCIN